MLTEWPRAAHFSPSLLRSHSTNCAWPPPLSVPPSTWTTRLARPVRLWARLRWGPPGRSGAALVSHGQPSSALPCTRGAPRSIVGQRLPRRAGHAIFRSWECCFAVADQSGVDANCASGLLKRVAPGGERRAACCDLPVPAMDRPDSSRFGWSLSGGEGEVLLRSGSSGMVILMRPTRRA